MTPAIATVAGSSPSASRMDQYFDENEDDFMMRIVHNSCNIPCQPAMMDHQLDVWTHCRQPLDFLSFFAHHPHRSSSSAVDGEIDPDDDNELYHLPMGAYALPKACEYCGAIDTVQCCPHDCRRPALYFARKKPPFAVAAPPAAAAAAVVAVGSCSGTVATVTTTTITTTQQQQLLLLEEQQQPPQQQQQTSSSPTTASDTTTSPQSWVMRGLMWH